MKYNRQKHLEWLKYSQLLSDLIFWENRNQYLQLMEDFVDASINSKKFETKFFEICRTDNKRFRMLEADFERLITFQPNFKSRGFESLISEIFSSCKVFHPDPDSREDYELDEEELRIFVRNTIPQIRNFCD